MAYDYLESWDQAATTENKSQDGKLSATAARVFTIVCDTIEEANDENGVRAGLPQLGSPHPRLGIGFTVSNINLTRNTPLMWEANVNYVTLEVQAGEDGQTPSPGENPPWALPATVTFGTAVNGGETEEDYDGNAIVNTAGVPFKVAKQFADMSITINKSLLGFDASAFWLFINKVNEDTYLGFAPGVLKCNGISATPNTSNGVQYYDVQVSLIARNNLDSPNLPQSQLWWWGGFSRGRSAFTGTKAAKNPAQQKYPTANDGDKELPLNQNGTLCDAKAGDTPFFLKYQIYDTAVFGEMGLF